MISPATLRRSAKPGARRRGPDAADLRVADRLAPGLEADTLHAMTQTVITTPSRKARTPQAERSAGTQTRLIDAAIICLHRSGYSATTVTMVADEAGVSRGAMTHQYPAKTDLMVAVVEAVFLADVDYYREVAARPASQWMPILPTLMWEVLSKPGAIAVTEIMLAARSDAVLAERLRAMQADIDVRAHRWVVEQMASIGMQERPDGDAVHRVFVAAVRGLALEALFRGPDADVKASIDVLTEVLQSLYPKLKILKSSP